MSYLVALYLIACGIATGDALTLVAAGAIGDTGGKK